ncbi:MAG: response regulator [Candidatus Omnitrophota bacterium]
MKKKVLIVDDEKEIVEFLKHFLERFNVNAYAVTRGDEAFDEYSRIKPDCVFLDIQLPGKDGLTILKELTKLDPQAQVIMITGKEDKEYQDKAKKYGAQDYITKPLDLSELKEKIEKYIIA